MANCSIIRNPNTNYIEKVLSPNGKESLLYKRALEHLRDIKDDVIINRSTNENEFLFQENGVTVTLKRRDSSDVYLEQINSESDFSTENVFKRVLDFFDKRGVTLFVDKNNTFSEKLIVNSGFVENREQPYYRGYLSEDYYVETEPNANSNDKEYLPKGTEVYVYEKKNGWSRIGHHTSNQWVEDDYLVNAVEM